MTTYVHNASLTGEADGFSLGNGATTPAPAGAILTAVTSTGGSITLSAGRWRCYGAPGAARLDLELSAASAQVSTEVLLDLTELPTGANVRVLEIRYATNYICRIDILTDGSIRVYNAANASINTSPTHTAGTRIRLHVGVRPGSTTSNGEIEVNTYVADGGLSTTPEWTYTAANQNLSTTATPITTIRYGRITSTAGSTSNVAILNIQVDDTKITEIGPLASTIPLDPVLVRKVVQKLDFSGSVGNPPLTLTCTQASGPVLPAPVINGLVAEIEDDINRVQAVSYNWTVTDTMGSSSGTETVQPPTTVAPVRLGRLAYIGGAWI